MGNIEIFQAASIGATGPARPQQPVQSGGGVTAPQQPSTRPTLPPPDTGKTWGGPTSKVDLNFGHHPGVDDQGQSVLIKLHPSGVPVWAETDTAVTPDQWVNMPKFQQEKILSLLPLAWKDSFKAQMDKGDPKKAQTQPQGVDNSQVSPMATTLYEMNQASQSPSAVADRARMQLAQANQTATVQGLAQREVSLAAEKTQLIQDLGDPQKAAEAQARLNLLDTQISEVEGVLKEVQSYHMPENLSPAEAQVVGETFKQINAQVQALSDPTKRDEAHAKLVVLYNHLADPSIANHKDPVLMSQATAVFDLRSRESALVKEMDALVPALNDPQKAAEAQARMDLLAAQIQQVHEAIGKVEAYRRPHDLSPQQAQIATNAFTQIEQAVNDLGNPVKQAAARAQLSQLYGQLTPGDSSPYQAAVRQEITTLADQVNTLLGQLRQKPDAEGSNQVRSLVSRISELFGLLPQEEPPAKGTPLAQWSDRQLETRTMRIYQESQPLIEALPTDPQAETKLQALDQEAQAIIAERQRRATP
ncbi:MAG TPA: hypothetical protein V6D05_02620 [Stenomitos sp.]